MRLIECVPNFSEGRDLNKIKLITNAIESVEGITVLDVDPGSDTNRTVVTCVGSPEIIAEAAFQGIKTASEQIDMSKHMTRPTPTALIKSHISLLAAIFKLNFVT